MAGAGEPVEVDVAVVGSGFAGSLVAMSLARRGQRVALVERGRHPRFAIGESSTPLANLLLEELADRYDLPQVRVFSKWGTWQRARPDVAGGLKRGFSFFFHGGGAPFGDDPTRARQMLVAASPHDGIADTHWYRPDFDRALMLEAQAAGAIYLDETRIERVDDDGVRIVLEARRLGQGVRVAAGFVVDASGPRGFLHHALSLPPRPFRWLPPTQGLYSHFEDVGLWADVHGGGEAPPFPPDAAALHHVFPGGWIWVLRFNNGITSAGAALTDPLADALGAAEGEAAWQRLLERLPSVAEQFRRARPVLPFIHAPRVAFRSGEVCGERWALLPSAAGVIDPLLSTGFPLTLLGVSRLLTILEQTSAGDARQTALREYAETTQRELDVTEQLVGSLYASMDAPDLFKRVSLLYFAAASFSETARRLDRHGLAPGFMLNEHPRFGPELRACAGLAATRPQGRARAELCARIDRAIEPFDVAGLTDRTRRDWYPVRAGDLLAAAGRLGASRSEVERLLERSGFAARQV